MPRRFEIAESQEHGFIFQELLAPAFPGWVPNRGRHKWDIPLEITKDYNTSMKLIRHNGNIDLGSMPRNWEINENFRLILGTYRQEGNYKRILSIDEYLFTPKIWSKFRGSITLQEVIEMEKIIQLTENGGNFAYDKYEEARSWYKDHIKNLTNQGKIGNIKPACKIDSKGQRRWQCTLPRISIIATFGNLSYNTTYRNVTLSTPIYSPPRKRNKKGNK